MTYYSTQVVRHNKATIQTQQGAPQIDQSLSQQLCLTSYERTYPGENIQKQGRCSSPIVGTAPNQQAPPQQNALPLPQGAGPLAHRTLCKAPDSRRPTCADLFPSHLQLARIPEMGPRQERTSSQMKLTQTDIERVSRRLVRFGSNPIAQNWTRPALQLQQKAAADMRISKPPMQYLECTYPGSECLQQKFRFGC